MFIINKKNILLIIIFNFIFNQIPDAVGHNGAVSSSNKYATQVGIDILKEGGNAIDAAIAVGFALAVTHPAAGNIGGGGFMVIRLEDGNVNTIDFREKAPELSSRNMFLDEDENVIPGKSWNTIYSTGVPGTVDGFGKAHELYGSLPWEMLLTPAIKLAKDGFNLDYMQVKSFKQYHNFLSRDSISRNIFTNFKKNINISENFKQPELAATLKRIQMNGSREFYEGKTANYILDCMERTNGLVSKLDLINYNSIVRDPIVFKYRDYFIYSMPPPSSGGIALAGILNQLENINLAEIEYHSPDHIQKVVEAERNVYADRAFYLGDMDFIDVPIEELISKKYSNLRWSSIDFSKKRFSSNVDHGNFNYVAKEKEETTHYSVTDQWGNAISVTTTINGWFGNGITVDKAGFLLNNEMDDFSSKPGEPNKYGLIGAEANAIEPGKRMLSSMTPTIVENPNNELFLVLGSPGGSTIITTVAQIIMNIIDYDMILEEAIEYPRFHHQWLPDKIYYEIGSLNRNDLDYLLDYGYNFKRRFSIGEANCIQYDSDKKIYYSSGDSRRRASAKAY